MDYSPAVQKASVAGLKIFTEEENEKEFNVFANACTSDNHVIR